MTRGISELLRMDDAFLARIRRGEGLGATMAVCVAVILVGCGTYGYTLGMWRGDGQALYATVKLPLMVMLSVVLTAALDVVICGLLRAAVTAKQALLCSLIAMATTSALLGALAPISFWFVAHAPPPAGDETLHVAQWLLTGHVIVFATAGVVGVRQLHGFLQRLVPDPAVGRRVLWAWLLSHGVVGAQLSWVMRPFVGKPGLSVQFFRDDAFHGTFFESVYTMTLSLMGPGGPLMIGFWIAVLVLIVAATLGTRPIERCELSRDTLRVWKTERSPPTDLPLNGIVSVDLRGHELQLTVSDEDSLDHDELRLSFPDVDAARRFYEALAWARAPGPASSRYRSS